MVWEDGRQLLLISVYLHTRGALLFFLFIVIGSHRMGEAKPRGAEIVSISHNLQGGEDGEWMRVQPS